MKKMYQIIKDATNEKLTEKSHIKISNQNGDDFQDDLEMADFCNQYFTSVGIEMEKQIPQPNKPHNLQSANKQSMFLTPVSQNEIIKHIHDLKDKSSPGIDGISAKLIKDTHIEILEPLLHILNRIYETGQVPSSFKLTVVTPIHKSGPKNVISNYRPISLITCFAKIFEKSLKDRLLNFLVTNNILSESQYGFLPERSTADALYRFTSDVTNHLNNGRKCLGVFIDLAKAFDTVPHNRLFEVLEHYGVRGNAMKLMRSYLQNRRQIVKINNVLSKEQIIKIGVPQGTVLGPVLFITYLNSLLEIKIDNGTIISYADDTALLFNGPDWNQTKKYAIEGLNKIKNWLETYKLSLNVTKTNYIAFSLTGANRPEFSYFSIDNINQIKETSETKYLGVYIDKNLKWHVHTEYLANRLKKLIYKFYIIRTFLNIKELIIIYKSLAESIIRYGILVWGGLYNNALQKLNIVHKYILKTIYKKPKLFPTEELFTEQTTNIRTLYISTICSYIQFHDNIKININHIYNTRSRIRGNLSIPNNLKGINLKFFVYLAPKTYNLLPSAIKQTKNKKKFNKDCNKYVHDNYHVFYRLF